MGLISYYNTQQKVLSSENREGLAINGRLLARKPCMVTQVKGYPRFICIDSFVNASVESFLVLDSVTMKYGILSVADVIQWRSNGNLITSKGTDFGDLTSNPQGWDDTGLHFGLQDNYGYKWFSGDITCSFCKFRLGSVLKHSLVNLYVEEDEISLKNNQVDFVMEFMNFDLHDYGLGFQQLFTEKYTEVYIDKVRYIAVLNAKSVRVTKASTRTFFPHGVMVIFTIEAQGYIQDFNRVVNLRSYIYFTPTLQKELGYNKFVEFVAYEGFVPYGRLYPVVGETPLYKGVIGSDWMLVDDKRETRVDRNIVYIPKKSGYIKTQYIPDYIKREKK